MGATEPHRRARGGRPGIFCRCLPRPWSCSWW
jgi:hypothetical protein